MDESGFTSGEFITNRVAIWGLGLMGGSLAMALRGHCAGVVGIDVDQGVVAKAVERGIVDTASTRPEDILNSVDLIVLAAPVRGIIADLELLDAVCAGSAVVMDLGSTKTSILEAMDRLPERFDPVGAHPMCGREKSSLDFADPGLFQNAPFALVALPRSSTRARALAEAVARAVDACPLWLDAESHDRWVAATSHTPFLLASALAHAVPREAQMMVGPGFRGTARLAASSTEMMVDILATNADNVRSTLNMVRDWLEQYDHLLEQRDFARLAREFEFAADQYRWLTGA